MKMKISREVDSRWAWIVAFASCWVNFSIYGLWRSYGVFFVAFMRDFDVSHRTASWPFTLCCAVYHLIGPIVGLLNHKYSLRTLQAIGCIVASMGVLLTYFANDFLMVIIFVGAVQGLGLGVIRTLSNVIIQQYFRRHRATATGIAMAGGTLSAFIFPTFAEFILTKFGLKTSFVVFGTIILQALIGIYVQKPPTSAIVRCSDTNSEANVGSSTMESSNRNNGTQPILLPENNDETKVHSQHSSIHESNKKVYSNIAKDENANGTLLNSVEKVPKRDVYKVTIEVSETHKKPKESAFAIMLYLLSQPMFFLICALFVTYNICLQIYLMTIVDMTLERNIASKTNAILLITVFSIADLTGRVSFGWISDKGIAKPKNIAIICQLLLAVSVLSIPLVSSMFALVLCSISIGVLLGIITILWPILNDDYFGTERLAISLGLNCFFSGAESLVRPFLIGFYLDYLKSYDLLYFTISGLVLLTMALWLFEPVINKTRHSV